MRNLSINWLLRPLLALLLASALAAQSTGPFLVFPGGENAGGSGVWILPAATFQSKQLMPGNLLMSVDSDEPVFVENGWHRQGDDFYLLNNGVPVAVAFGFFNSDVTSGLFYAADTSWGDWRRVVE
jgi:hypothetical protein